MKKLIAAALAAASMNASAFVGTGNSMIEEARIVAEDSQHRSDQVMKAFFLGAVGGLSTVFAEKSYPYAVCYPDDSTLGQLGRITAKYLIDNPEELHKDFNYLTWASHLEAFGFLTADDCDSARKPTDG